MNKSLKISEIKHGKLDIDYVSSNFSSIDAVAKYTNVSVNFDAKAAYNANLFTKYGSVKLPAGSRLAQTEPSNNSVQVDGSVGTSPKASVKISNSYANINIK